MSGNAASDIRSLIEDSLEQVNGFIKGTQERIRSGEDATNQASDIFDVIVREIDDIRERITDVSSANEEQRIGVEQISDSLRQIDESTQRNTEASRKVGDLSVNLKDESHQVIELATTIEKLVFGRASREQTYLPVEKTQKMDVAKADFEDEEFDFDSDDESFKDAV